MISEIKFGTDGIRGTAGVWPITAKAAMIVGKGLGKYLSENNENPAVVIGKDTRNSGTLLSNAVSAGLQSEGVDVIDVGIIPTAGIAFSIIELNIDAGVIVSASHNPSEQNGIKIIGHNGIKLNDEKEKVLQDYISQINQDFNLNDDGNRQMSFGNFEYRPGFVSNYIEHLIHDFKGQSIANLKIAIDCSNGAASTIAQKCFSLLGCDPLIIHASPNGSNINLNCGSEFVRGGESKLADIVKNGNYDLGIAYDGDADRVVFVNSDGYLLDGDHILFILATYLKERGKLRNNTVVTTIMANQGLEKALADHRISTIRTQVGDKYILDRIRKDNLTLGGEQSGHILVYDAMHTTGDGIYTSLFIASILQEIGKKNLNYYASALKKHPQIIASAQVENKPALEGIPNLLKLKEAFFKQFGVNSILNIRYSGTESMIRVMAEAGSENMFSVNDLARAGLEICRHIQKHAGFNNDYVDIMDLSSGNSIIIE